jgi:hypothetical protein
MIAFFVYSTGRCATQALARYFAANLGDRAVVEHEPLRAAWAPRIALRHPDLAALRRKLPEVDRHLDRIARTLAEGRVYVETGWPAFAWYPYLESLMGADFRWVHLVRNPLYVAGSLVTRGCYDPRRAHPEYAALAQLVPTDHGVSSHDLAAEWSKLSQYEKCLFQWLEINRYAIELTRTMVRGPVAFARYEDIFGSSAKPLRELYLAAGLGEPCIDRAEMYDRHQTAALTHMSFASSHLRQDIEALAVALHYDRREVDIDVVGRRVQWRYSRPWRGATRTGVKTALRFAKISLLRSLQP